MPLLQPRDGRQRRRLRGAGLPRGPRPTSAPWTTCATLATDAARARASAWCSTWCSTTSPASTSGRQRARAGDPRYRDYFHVFPDRDRCPTPTSGRCPRSSPTSRPAASPGTTTSTAGCGRRSTTGSGTSTGRTPTCSCEYADIVLFLANLGVEVLRLDAIAFIWKRLGTNCQNQPEVHALTQALRAVARIACPGGGVQGRGDRRAAATWCSTSGTGAHARQGQRPRLPQQPDGADLVDAGHRRRRAGPRRRSRALPPTPADRHLDHLRPLPRRHRLGHRRRRRRGGRPGRVRAPPVPVRLVRRRVPRARGPAGWSSRHNPATGDRRISGTAASLAGLAGGAARRGRAPALARIFLAHAIVAGWGGMPVIWSGDELGLPNDPRLGRRAGPRGRQPLGAPAAPGLGAWPRRARPAHRPGPGLPGPARTWPGSAPALPQLHASAPTRGAARHRRRGAGRGPPAPERADGRRSTTSPASRRPFPLDQLHDARPHHAVRRPRRPRGRPPAPTACSGCPRTPRGGSWTPTPEPAGGAGLGWRA